MSEKTKKQKILLFVPSRPISRNQFCRLMVGFRVDGHIYIYKYINILENATALGLAYPAARSYNT